MKTLTIVLFALLLSHHALAQISVSLGFNRLSESEINLQSHFLEPRDFQLQNVYWKGSVGASFQRDRQLFSLEVGYLNKLRVQYYTVEFSAHGGGSTPYQTNTTVYQSTIGYSYVGLKLGYAYTFEGESLFNKKWRSLVELGGNIGLDVLSSYDEYSHYTHSTYTYNNSWTQQTYVTDEYSYEPFRPVGMSIVPIHISLYIARRLSFKNVYIRGSLSFGILNNVRVTPLNDYHSWYSEEPPKRYFLSTDVGIGYTFKSKENDILRN